MQDITCKWCGRHLNLKNVEMFVGEIICNNSKCKGGTYIKFVSNNPYSIHKQITETKPKDKQEKQGE